MNTSYLDALNEKQREAAEAIAGPVIVLAGAGSGKTKTLITRMAHLIQNGVEPSSILAVTFTNKAAAEMKHRVHSVLSNLQHRSWSGGQWAQPWMGFSAQMPEVSTFHSFCVKLLRNETNALGFTRPFIIYDDSDQLSLIKKILDEYDISSKNANPKRFKGAIDSLKCQALGPEDVNPGEFFGPFGDQLLKVYTRYQEVLRSCHALDFGDLIVETYKILKRDPKLLEKYQDKFKYIMVDEYQDTNRAQYLLINILAQKYKNICVVGDEDQSIYKWRGADIRNILDFQRDYGNAQLVKLEQNYRSTKTIINAASAVIKNNESRYDKTLWTANEVGDKIKWAQVPDERAEAEFVCKEIQKWLNRNPDASFREVAIFYRSHAQSRALEEAFRKYRLSYKIVGGVGFYERKEIKDALAYLRVLVNPDDTISLLRIINTPARGLGKTTLDKLEAYATSHKLSFYAGIKKFLAESSGELPPSATKKLVDFVKLMDSLRDLATRSKVGEIYHRILDATGYVTELKAEGRIQNLEELDTVIQFFEEDASARGMAPGEGMLQGFLNQITLEASLLEKTEESNAGAVSMMTLHSSKGLEFPLVFLVGCEEGIFPSRLSIDESGVGEEAIEEERRLCYVGITRAMKNLFLTTAQMRRIYGQVQVSSPSRFISEIPAEYLEAEIQRGDKSTSAAWSYRAEREGRDSFSPQRKSSTTVKAEGYRYDYDDDEPSYKVAKVETPEGKDLSVGQKVKHDSYGVGTVRLLEGSASDRKVTIEFSNRTTKKFSLKHVQLEVV